MGNGRGGVSIYLIRSIQKFTICVSVPLVWTESRNMDWKSMKKKSERSMDSVYPKINTHVEPCVNLSDPRRTCGRHRLCTRCTNKTARQKTAELYGLIGMMAELKPWVEVGGELTRTLPGVKHPSKIRGAPLYKQYEYWTRKSQMWRNGRPSKWASYLRSVGVVARS